ncbi:hypothetical protein EYF80_059881 [Liparis tanakae]|uniref:Uncharacterized protein n=1 Tax=Liparis tanakae TaxID=230148 RepID=A0A4Z2EN07_9TELE|nr:hypothetical protein EYF80_059881 [Liparis tanakae]
MGGRRHGHEAASGGIKKELPASPLGAMRTRWTSPAAMSDLFFAIGRRGGGDVCEPQPGVEATAWLAGRLDNTRACTHVDHRSSSRYPPPEERSPDAEHNADSTTTLIYTHGGAERVGVATLRALRTRNHPFRPV